ncbi:AAA family ATPase, partial [Thermus thermophilus]|uniref:AAA family ATPase n=1 Tax=Thermus thermophilus TaxID=274 RepID=UPI00311A4C36
MSVRCACGQKNPPEARYCLACGQLLGAKLPRETRFVSVVFFDLANSTEAFRQGLSPAYRRLREALEEAAGRARARGGFVHRFLGDGVLVFFGAPRSQGLEPWRALAAAWDMVRHSPFPARAGVASGEALWGPLGSGYAGEPTLLGPPVNLAERLSKLAAPGEVLTEATTLRLAPGAEGALLGSREVKGMGQVPVYRLVRLALDLPPHRRPLLQTLEARLLTERRLVVHGPAGSGKSFLLEVFRERRARGLPFPTVRLQRMGPEMPLRATLYRAVTEAFGAPEALLRNLPGDLAEALAYSLGLAPRPPWEKRALDEAILAAWREALMGLKTPLLLLLQDLHYPDRTLERFLERMPENLLVLAESRRPLFPARLGLEGLEAPPPPAPP